MVRHFNHFHEAISHIRAINKIKIKIPACVYLLERLFICLSVCLNVGVCVVFIGLSVCLCIYIPACLSAHLACFDVCPVYFFLCVFLSVYLCFICLCAPFTSTTKQAGSTGASTKSVTLFYPRMYVTRDSQKKKSKSRIHFLIYVSASIGVTGDIFSSGDAWLFSTSLGIGLQNQFQSCTKAILLITVCKRIIHNENLETKMYDENVCW